MKILLVDDEIEFISTLSERLTMRGIESDYVTSGAKAIQAAQGQRYDLVVLDMKMAGLGGLETLDRIRLQAPAMPFIILTGHGDEEAYHQAIRAGVGHYLVKPLDIEVLIEKIQQAIAGRGQVK